MENTNSKIITLSFMVTAILIWLVIKIMIGTFGGMVGGGFGKAMGTDFAREILPVLIGIAVFAALQFNKRVLVWADEVVAELRKIVWPSRKDTTAMTIVVCIMLVISGLVIGGFDIASSFTIEALLSLHIPFLS